MVGLLGMDEIPARSGYELAAKILETHPNDAIETMLKYSGGAESDWLEFKAGMKLLPEAEKRHETLDDLYWDYLLSIVAMANTRGGAFVIGVHDKTHEAVPLESCDPGHIIEKRGKEAYLREVVVNNLDRPERKWKTKGAVTWSIPQSIVPFLEKKFIPYQGTDIIVFLVPPRKIGEEIFVTSHSGLGEFEHLPVRDMGEIGHVKRLTRDKEFANHRANREQQLLSSQFGTWWTELDAEANVGREDAELDEAIRAYYAKLDRDTRKRLQAFIPLDAAGDGEPDEEEELEFEDPTAVSVFDEDDELDGQPNAGDDEPDESDESADEFDSEEESDNEQDHEPKTIRMGLSELLGQYDRVVLSGEPGAGKTTCLAHFALERGKAQGDRPHLFAFVQLGRWAAGGSVLSLVGKYCGLTLSQIDALLAENRLHLVLDALNECPDHLRPAALENIRVLVREHPDLPVILSSRKAEAFHLPGFPVFEVQAMYRDRQRQFLERHLGSADKAAAILDALEKQPGGASIAQNPMLLKMVVDVVRNSESLPSGRATLYRAWLEKWYAREEKKARKAKDALPWTAAEALRLLAQVAFAGRLQGYRDIPIKLARRSLHGADGTILRRLCQGPLLGIEEGFVHFRHETFQEYLCAEWLLAEPTALNSFPKRDYNTWGMPIAYAAELRLPGKLPKGLSTLVWGMNPWIAALFATPASVPDYFIDSKNPGVKLAIALARGENLFKPSLNGVFCEEIARGSLFLFEDIPLSYLVHMAEDSYSRWIVFECAYVLRFLLFKRNLPPWKKEPNTYPFQEPVRRKSKPPRFLSLNKGNVLATIQTHFPDISTTARLSLLFNVFISDPLDLEGQLQVVEQLNIGTLPMDVLPLLHLSGLREIESPRVQLQLKHLFGEDFLEKAVHFIQQNPAAVPLSSSVRLLYVARKDGMVRQSELTARYLLEYVLHEMERTHTVKPLIEFGSDLKLLTDIQGGVLDPAIVSTISPKLRQALKENNFAFLPSKTSSTMTSIFNTAKRLLSRLIPGRNEVGSISEIPHADSMAGIKCSVDRAVQTGVPSSSPTSPFVFVDTTMSKSSRNTSLPSAIHVYIDEAWPGSQNKSKKDIGVIAGIVWMGDMPDYHHLPSIPTHLHVEGGSALKELLQCEKAIPFAFPIRLSESFNPNPEKYMELLAHSVVLLLGWVLPRPTGRTKVFIHAERYATFEDGSDETAFFQTLLAGASMTQNRDRFSMWDVEQVEWQGKSFEYIPYGDLVGYLFAETSDAKRMAKQFRVAKWPGCVPFSPDLLPVLRDLDAKEPAGVAGALFRLAALCGESNLFRTSLADTIRRAKEDDALRNAILERICDEFENKNRNLRRFALVADAFFEAFPDADFDGRPKLRFLRLLANLQKANHDGDPAAVEAALRSYSELRGEMLKRDLDLCVYGDLNLAVHFNDRFSFSKAETLLRSCRDAPAFPYLSARNRGRILSSLGQSAALTGRPSDADALFLEALDAFAETGDELANEADQTRVYRAFASLDAPDKETSARIAEALTVPIDEAVRRPETIADHPFREHLLVKTLWYAHVADTRPDWTQFYLSTSSSWTFAPQHPWELILLYRGLLAWKTDPALAYRCFGEWDEWFRTVPHGGTLALIRGFGLVAMKRHCGTPADDVPLEDLLKTVAEDLPDTAATVNALRRVARDSSQESLVELWTLLPFNYK